MQRAAAKSSPSSPATSNGPPAKKARLSYGASAVGTSDQEIIQSGLDAEEAKRQAALDKAAQYAGETKWVLSFQDTLKGKRQDAMQVRHAGYAEIDAQDDSEEDGEEEEDTRPVRMQFGGGVKKADTSVPMVKTDDSESDSESSSDDYDSDDAAADLIRQTKREMASEKRESKKKRANMGNSTLNGTLTRQNENRSLNGLTSISGGRRSDLVFFDRECDQPTFCPFSTSMYSSPTIIFIWLSSMKLSWSPFKAAPSLLYMNLASAR
ncbi:hypothetical protein GGP41_007121 [Bipolaris sorokiniana]|uniref:Uncharacterized protein n=1 Tax=Cochliobolus sativus TaxID=45130 RepID=A0A8H5ZU03_COCSA|nr:hypothetical protein GGP41_007121 [Bipolaris sorokiniana]